MSKFFLKKYDFLTELLMDLFYIDRDQFKSDIQSSFKVISVDLEKLGAKLIKIWSYLLENTIDFSLIQEEYLEKLKPWNEKYNAFKQVKTRKDFTKFLEQYFSTWVKLRFEKKDISKKEIHDILRHEKLVISSLVQNSYGHYKSFPIFNEDMFEITAHVKLKEYETKTYSLLIIISFWFENNKESWNANLRDINEDYKNSMIAYEIIKKLKTLEYQESSLIIKPQEEDNPFSQPLYDQFENTIHPSDNLVLELLSDNPITLFEEFVSHLYYIEEIIQNFLNEQDISPTSYFENLTSELQQFLLKGKNLFLKAEDFLQKSQIIKDEIHRREIKEVEDEKITFNQIIAFFKDALENDKLDITILPKDRGFRTQNQIYETYKEKIDVSLPTFYKYFENLKVESYLEVRTKSGKGGGKQYRYKELKAKADQVMEEISEIKSLNDQSSLTIERITLQEALTYYNNKDYTTSTQLFKNVLESEDLTSYKNLYYTCLYYLGRSLFKIGNYTEALECFKKAYNENQSLLNVKYSLIESYLHLQDNKKALQHVNEILSKFKEIFEENNVNLNRDYLFVSPFDLDNCEIILPKLLEQDLFSKFSLLTNKTQIKIQHFTASKIRLTQRMYELLNHNITSLQILYKKYLSSLFLKLEILRRQFFIEMLNFNEERINEILDEFIDHIKYLNEEPFLYNISIEDYETYISYFKGLSKLLQNQQIQEKLSIEFPEIDKSYSYPKDYYLYAKFAQYYQSLRYYNEIFYENYSKRERIYFTEFFDDFPSREKITDQILKAEYYFVLAYTNLHYLIDKRIKSEEELTNKTDFQEINTLEDVFKKYENFHSTWLGREHPIFYKKAAEKAFEFCKEHNYSELIKHSKNISMIIEEKYAIIQNLRKEWRNKVINKKLEVLRRIYKKTQEIFELSYQKEPKEEFSHFIHSRLKKDVEKIVREKKGMFNFIFQLFNPELNEDVMEELRNFTLYRESVEGRARAHFIVKLEPEEISANKSILVKITYYRDFERESGDFGRNLDKINWLIYNAINLNLDSFNIKINEKEAEHFRTYFAKEFQNEYENEFFKFDIIEIPNCNEFIVLINRV